jgi:ribonuclease HI
VAILVFTDGACLGNPGPGGWAWARTDGPWASGCEAQSTNQRMEIAAALEALRAHDGETGPIEIRSDSTYVVHCFRDRWWEGWLRRGWVNKAKKPVKNRDLWEPLIDLVRSRGNVSFSWVKGHSGDPMNDLVDALAVAAAKEQAGAAGDEHPDEPGEADRPGGAGTASDSAIPPGIPEESGGEGPPAWAIAGFPLVIGGHRPTELGGYGDNDVAAAVRRKLTEIVDAHAQMHDDLVVMSGLRLGAEQLGAQAALDAGVPFVAVLPYPDPDAPWPAVSRARFAELCAAASEVFTLQRVAPSSKQQAGAALRRRDAWLARHASAAVMVWDGDDDLVGRSVRSLQEQLGDDVWVLDPTELT